MTRDDIIAMARQCGVDTQLDTLTCYGGFVEVFEQFAAFVAAAEREKCAKVCEDNADEGDWGFACISCANHIRARGEIK